MMIMPKFIILTYHIWGLSDSVVSRIEGKAERKEIILIHDLIIDIVKGNEIDSPDKFSP